MLFPAERRRVREAMIHIERELMAARRQAVLAEGTVGELTAFIASCCKDRPSDPFWADKSDAQMAAMFLHAMRSATEWRATCARFDALWNSAQRALHNQPWNCELGVDYQHEAW